MSILIGITGRAGAGKDTVADYLRTDYGFTPMAFADPLKAAASTLFNLPLEHFYDRDLKEAICPEWGMSPRHMAQRLGTEAMRGTFGQDFWIKRWIMEYGNMPAWMDVVVTDVRFNNEAQAIRDMGGMVLHIRRPGDGCLDGAAAAHASEAGVTYISSYDKVLVNDGSIEDLYRKVDSLFAWDSAA